MFRIQTCCNHILSAAAEFRGQEATKFCQFYLVLSLFYSFKRGSNGFIAEKTILILYQGSRGGPLFSGGSNFFQGGGGLQMPISIETHIRNCYFPGGGGGFVWTPYPPLDPRMGNVIITGQYLSQSGF